MSLSVNGQSQVPPGFRFHPTEEELLQYYLRKKVAYEKIDLDVIRDVDLNKLEPWDIQDRCKIGSTPQNDWYFFSHKDKKYPTGTRTNRATAVGFWKATGRDKVIYSNCKRIGMRKTLVFYKGRAPHGKKLDWIMHEYRLDDNTNDQTSVSTIGGESLAEDGWVVCRVFKKKNYHKAMETTQTSSSTSMDTRIHMHSSNNVHDGVLDQILAYMGRSCKQEHDHQTINKNENTIQLIINPNNSSTSIDNDHHACFMNLPRLESPTIQDDNDCNTNWVALDRFVASQLNGGAQVEVETKQLPYYNNHNHDDDEELFSFSLDHHEETRLTNSSSDKTNQVCNSGLDFWSFAPSSSSDPLGHLSI